MTTVIRVHPQVGGAYGYGGDAAALQAQNQVALTQQQLQNERDTSNLRLQYERALWQEKMKETQLQSAVQYGAAGTPAVASPYAALGVPGLLGAGMGALGLGGLAGLTGMGVGQPLVTQAYPAGVGGGQTNVTNQSATGAANQSVTNSNSYASTTVVPQWASPFGGAPFGGAAWGASPYGYGGYSGGGFISNLLRGLF
jgi:hypothetical protein